jgi:hypothetical protein
MMVVNTFQRPQKLEILLFEEPPCALPTASPSSAHKSCPESTRNRILSALAVVVNMAKTAGNGAASILHRLPEA